jgi:hypothetical protein
MTNRLGNQAPRRLACSACGVEFSCGLSGSCWCAEETARLAMPVAGEDCLCRDCLRKLAAQVQRNAAG